ncbi:MAG: sensor histidine kinase, partial [Acidaminobacteraceae bacterium]
PVFYYFNRDVNPIVNSFFVGVFGLIFRSSLTRIALNSFTAGFFIDYNILFFDIAYGMLYYILFYRLKKGEFSLMHWFIIIWTCDFIANFVEILSRLTVIHSEIIALINKLMLVALVRSLIALAAVFIFEYYRLIFQKEKQIEKYEEMLDIVSDLKGEAYFIKSNMSYIENVMKEAYELYESLNDPSDKMHSLKIAKDIHEVKKNYQRVLVGIEKLGDSSNSKLLKVSELLSILKESYERDSSFKNKKIDLEIRLEFDIEIAKHYYLMSVIRNLVGNSIESFQDDGFKIIRIAVLKEGGFLKLSVLDNGSGIKAKNKTVVFQDGYSTKFNQVTGDIYRGMGLPIVKDIIEKEFYGSITLKSELKMGTEIIIKIPIDGLGEYHYEVLSN